MILEDKFLQRQNVGLHGAYDAENAFLIALAVTSDEFVNVVSRKPDGHFSVGLSQIEIEQDITAHPILPALQAARLIKRRCARRGDAAPTVAQY